MSGEHDLPTLLRSLAPALDPAVYVVCIVAANWERLLPLARGTFLEREGMTLILEANIAQANGVQHDGPRFKRITLTVHSSLEAVGLTAAVAGALARANIPCNIVAGYFHDHLFVREHEAQRAIQTLIAIAGGAAQT